MRIDPTDSQSAEASLVRWWVLAILTLLATLGIIVHYLISMLVGGMKADLALTDFQMGTAMGPAFGLVYAFAGVAMGWLSDRYSRRLVLLLAVTLFGVSHALTGLAESYGQVLVLRMLTAIGASAVGPASVSIIAEKFGKGRLTTAIAIFSTSNKLGLGFTFALGGLALHWATNIGEGHWLDLAPWRLVFLMTGLPAVALGLLVFTFGDSRSDLATRDPDKAPLQSLFAFCNSERKLLTLMLLGFTLIACCTQGLIAWVPSFMSRHLHQTPLSYGSTLGLFSTLAAGAVIIKGVIMDRLFARGIKDIALRFYTWLLVGALPFMATAFLTDSYAIFFACYFLVAVIAVPFGAYILAAAMVISPPHLRGQMSALVGLPIFAIGGAGPMLMGWLTDHVFQDEAAIGKSIALVLCLFVPAGVLCLRAAMRPLREAAARAEARAAQVP